MARHPTASPLPRTFLALVDRVDAVGLTRAEAERRAGVPDAFLAKVVHGSLSATSPKGRERVARLERWLADPSATLPAPVAPPPPVAVVARPVVLESKPTSEGFVAWLDGAGHTLLAHSTGPRDAVTLRRLVRVAGERLVAAATRLRELRAIETPATPIEPALVEYEAELVRRGTARRYRIYVLARSRALLAGLSVLEEVTPRRIRERLTTLVRERNLTARTARHYLASLSSFLAFLVEEERLAENPAERVRPPRVGDPSYVRRAITADEFDRLLASAPPDRALCYWFLLSTAARRGETGQLTWGDFDLVDVDAASFKIRASVSKNRRAAVLPLAPRISRALRDAKPADAKPTDLVFPRVPKRYTFRKDLQAAGIDAGDPATGTLDVHALRNSHASHLVVRAGVPLAVAQRSMRHSTPTLTASYVRLESDDLRGAVVKLERTLRRSS